VIRVQLGDRPERSVPGPFRVRECWPALVHVNRASGPGGCSVVCGAGAGPAIPGDGGWVKKSKRRPGRPLAVQDPSKILEFSCDYEMQSNVKNKVSCEQLIYCSNILCVGDSMQYLCRLTHIVVPSKILEFS